MKKDIIKISQKIIEKSKTFDEFIENLISSKELNDREKIKVALATGISFADFGKEEEKNGKRN